MARILLIGDSQAGNPGAAAKRALEAAGHQVTQVHNDGKSPIAYVNTPDLWSQYTALAGQHDLVLLIFGHNSQAGSATRNALVRMRDGVHPPVYMSGPPLYPATARPTSTGQPSREAGDALRAQNQQIFGDRYIDAYPSTPASLARDAAGWHLTLSSAQGWGQAMADVMNRVASSAPAAPTTGGGGGAASHPREGVGSLLLAAGATVVAIGGMLVIFRRRRA